MPRALQLSLLIFSAAAWLLPGLLSAQPISVRPEFPREFRGPKAALLLPPESRSEQANQEARVLVRPEVPVQLRATVLRAELPEDELRVVTLFENAAPAVAAITTELLSPHALAEQGASQGAGSGFLWDHQGHIVTSNHVLNNARRIFVQMEPGKPQEASIVGRAPDYDLAVIRLSNASPPQIKPIPLGESHNLRVGQRVYAIGNPFGLQRSLTQGLVSALGRELPTPIYREVAGIIQTDAAINPGNSGGPLLDSAGRLVGVNAAIRAGLGGAQAGFAGIGFAIPVDLVNRIVPELIAKGRAPDVRTR